MMKNTYKYKRMMAVMLFGAMLASCSGGGGGSPVGGPTTYTIGGIVSGLTGTGLALRNNGADDLDIASDGRFTFGTKLLSGASYSVTIKTMPNDPTLTCVITNNTGTVLTKPVAKVLVMCHPVAGAAVPTITDNINFTLTQAAGDPNWVQNGAGGIVGNTIVNDYILTNAMYTISEARNFLIEAVLSSQLPPAVGEAGARLMVRAHTDDLTIDNQFHEFQVRLQKAASDADNFVGLYNQNGALVNDTLGNPAKIVVDWSDPVSPNPRLRIRLMRVGDEIRLGVERANVFDNDASSQTVNVALNNTNFPSQIGAADLQELKFGNALAGSEISTWDAIHITVADDKVTQLPYWPATLPAPTLVHDDKGAAGQAVVFYVDLGSPPMTVPYLTTDVATLSLVHSGGTSTVSVTDPSTTNDGLQYTTFSGLASGQTVSGFVTVCEISGRCSSSTTVGVVIP